MPEVEREAKILARLSHPNIVHYLVSLRSNNSTVFNILMELVTGGSLSSLILAENLADYSIDEDVFKWFRQNVEALAYIHNLRIQHRAM